MMNQNAKTGTGRAAAGKALIIFLVMMVVLTLINRALTDMIIPTVTTYSPQRGALEIQINGSGVLQAAVHAPVVVPEAARVREILVKTGAGVKAGDGLLTLDYEDVLKDKHTILADAIVSAAEKRLAYDRASADVSGSALAALKGRQEALAVSEAALSEAQAAFEAAEGEENIVATQDALRRAQDEVDYRRRRVEELTDVRNYIDAGKELKSAQDKLKDAMEEYFGICRLLSTNPYEGAEEQGLVDNALKAVKDGGSVAEVLPFLSGGNYLSVLTSQVTGDVISIDVNVGAVVSTSGAVMTISDRSRELKLTVNVDEDSVEDMAVGDVAQIIIDTDVYDCPITGISASVENPGQFEVEFILPGDAGAVGMGASMRFKKRTQSYDILVPLAALRSDNDGNFIYVVDQTEGSLGANTTVRRVDVYVLDQDSTRAALQSGVSARDLVVARSDRSISDGDRVRLEGN